MFAYSVPMLRGILNGPTPAKIARRLTPSDSVFARLTPEQRNALRTTEGLNPEIASVPDGTGCR